MIWVQFLVGIPSRCGGTEYAAALEAVAHRGLKVQLLSPVPSGCHISALCLASNQIRSVQFRPPVPSPLSSAIRASGLHPECRGFESLSGYQASVVQRPRCRLAKAETEVQFLSLAPIKTISDTCRNWLSTCRARITAAKARLRRTCNALIKVRLLGPDPSHGGGAVTRRIANPETLVQIESVRPSPHSSADRASACEAGCRWFKSI
jgi:hypothetical protein